MTTSASLPRVFISIACALGVLASACSSTTGSAGSALAQDPIASEDASATASTSPVPDYTEDELSELAHSPQVERLNNPMGAPLPPDRALHVAMSDGTRLALSLYFPAEFDPAQERAPVVFLEGWYGRAMEISHTPIAMYGAAGFVVAAGDPRGFGASFGHQSSFLSEAQRSDEREMMAWLAAQPWSSGKVAVIGRSASAMLAESMASSGSPVLGAAIVRATEFDQYSQNLFLGGVPNTHILGLIGEIYGWMRGDACVAELAACAQLGLASVDDDADYSVLQAALRDHRHNVSGDLSSVVFRDDAIGAGSFDDVSPKARVAQLRDAAVPARVSASWLDGTTAKGALDRFNALPDVPMQVVIGATTHSGGLDADPFSRSAFEPARPGGLSQYAGDIDFLRRALSGADVGREVSYYVLGADAWKRTAQWPPQGMRTSVLQLSQSGLETGANAAAGERGYTVDPQGSSGAAHNRWAGQGDAPIYYGDRRLASGERLSFDGAPLQADMELVGEPELCVSLRSDQPDGIVIAYLEDVAPDGRVTYLTEGELRLLHRKTRSGGCDAAPGSERSFERADGAPVPVGELMQLELPLWPTAARIERGHRLRLSLAGADAGTFPMLTETPATWSVAYGAGSGSQLSIPLRPWSPEP